MPWRLERGGNPIETVRNHECEGLGILEPDTHAHVLHLRTLLTLVLGPALAILLPALILGGSRGYWELMRSWETGTSSAVEAEIRLAEPRSVRRVVLGSSVALTDLDERLLDRLLGAPEGSTLNLGIKAGSVATSAMLTPEVLDLTPGVVLFVVHTSSMSDTRTPRNAARFGRRRVPPSTIYHPSVARRVCSARSFVVERGYHLAGALGSANLLVRHRLDLRYLASRFLLHRGKLPTRHHPRSIRRLDEQALRDDLEAVRGPLQLSLDGPASASLRYVAAALSSEGVRLVVAPAPDHPDIRGAAYSAALIDLLTELQRQCGFDLMPLEALPEFQDPDFNDHHHMGPSGCLKFTTAVAEYLGSTG